MPLELEALSLAASGSDDVVDAGDLIIKKVRNTTLTCYIGQRNLDIQQILGIDPGRPDGSEVD
jgi:hypothetical protein